MPGEPTNCDITLRWISGHSNVTGNESVDTKAKKAAAGSSSPPISLPPILHQQRGLPVSLAAIRQNHMTGLKSKLHNIWETSL
ncbi:hypothetical protein BDQ17DRAFT_1256860 [Cyathus striatus]|nr:hypothetical protein BDQ17DRAFT_1256860 [Cyathus striatus]